MNTTRISQRELESYLWGAAVVLRGLIDAGDYKQYIFPLVFLKRISDVYDEEHAAAMEIYGDEDLSDLPENHRFAIPDGCHWDDIRSVTPKHRCHGPQGHACHRVRQPRHPARRVRGRRLGQ
jgi:type I restriction enzyme M protein